MLKRIQSIILFVTIGLLLTVKAGLSIWHASSDDIHQTADAQTTSTPSTSTRPASTLTASIQPTIPETLVQHPGQGETHPQTTSPASANDSWAMLEKYLIPEANAESSPHTSAPVIEDETLTSLRKYKGELEQRSRKLDAREQSLRQAEDQLKQRITELEQLEASIQQRLSDESKVKNKKIKRLTAVYEGMKPERSAPVIAQMELATVVKIFLLMDEKKVGKILSFLPPEKAVTISQALTSQISSVQ